MKNFSVATILALVLGFGIFSAPTAEAQRHGKALSTVCKTVRGTSGFIYKNSAPLRSGGVGTPLVGFRYEPTVISNIRGVLLSSANIYDTNGATIGRCPFASAQGHAGRYRCTMKTSSLRRAAVRNTRSPAVLFQLKGKSCVLIPDAGKCYGSVKGACNRTIK